MDILKEWAARLDNQGIPWKTVIIGFSFAQYLLETWLQLRQHKKLQGNKIPVTLKGEIDQATFDKSQRYNRAKSNFTFIKELYNQVQNVLIIRYDLLVTFWQMAKSALPYLPARFSGEKSQSVIFFLIFNLVSTILGLPVSLYSTFVIEEEFGFNKQTIGLFVSDLIKTQILTAVMGGPILAGILKIIESTGDKFFVYICLFALFLQAFMITIYPIFILPLFNKLTPLEEGEVKNKTESLATKLNFPLKHLYKIDGSKRSAHSNAYFYGLPWAKHIVIYDTLLEKSEADEVVAVLAHELGHWGLSHTTKLFFISQFHMFYVFALFSLFIHNQSLYDSFGFKGSQPILIGLLLFNDLLQPLDTIVKLGMSVLSRTFEYQADAFAVKLGYADMLAKALIKLQIQNLSTMDVDSLYSTYHYTHPVLPERLAAIGYKGDKKQ